MYFVSGATLERISVTGQHSSSQLRLRPGIEGLYAFSSPLTADRKHLWPFIALPVLNSHDHTEAFGDGEVHRLDRNSDSLSCVDQGVFHPAAMWRIHLENTRCLFGGINYTLGTLEMYFGGFIFNLSQSFCTDLMTPAESCLIALWVRRWG